MVVFAKEHLPTTFLLRNLRFRWGGGCRAASDPRVLDVGYVFLNVTISSVRDFAKIRGVRQSCAHRNTQVRPLKVGNHYARDRIATQRDHQEEM